MSVVRLVTLNMLVSVSRLDSVSRLVSASRLNSFIVLRFYNYSSSVKMKFVIYIIFKCMYILFTQTKSTET